MMGGMPRPVFIRGFPDFLKSRFSSRIHSMLNLVREGEEDYVEAIRYRRRLKVLKISCFVLLKRARRIRIKVRFCASQKSNG